MFRANDFETQQTSFKSAFYWMSEEHRNLLKNSWAGVFRENIMKGIDETPYAVLYSDKLSRPNAPVNVLIGMMLIETLFNIPEDMIGERTIFDMSVQYALGLENLENVNISIRTLERFRRKCIEYETETGIDLIHNTIVGLASQHAEVMNLSGEKFRMDSLMVNSYIRTMGRLELIFEVNQNLVFALAGISKNFVKSEYKDLGKEKYKNPDSDRSSYNSEKVIAAAVEAGIPESLHRYLNPYEKNVVIYHNDRNKLGARMEDVLADAMTLHDFCNETHKELEEYKIFERVIGEQCRVAWYPDENGIATIRKYELLKKGEGMNSGMCQNPYDPEATYREKAGKEYRGYVANILEESNEKGNSIIREYEFAQNNVSDNDLGAATLNKIGKQEGENKVPVVVDGAYVGDEFDQAAANNNFEPIHTALNGNGAKDHEADHVFNKDGTTLETCAGGQTPLECSYDKKGSVNATMDSERCKACPFYNECKPTVKGDKAVVKTSIKKHRRAIEQRLKAQGLWQLLSNFRNGVETIPSLMRNHYDVDTMPIRGKAPMKLRFGIIVGAVNFKKFFKYSIPRGEYA